jgi:hypothetical protein
MSVDFLVNPLGERTFTSTRLAVREYKVDPSKWESPPVYHFLTEGGRKIEDQTKFDPISKYLESRFNSNSEENFTFFRSGVYGEIKIEGLHDDNMELKTLSKRDERHMDSWLGRVGISLEQLEEIEKYVARGSFFYHGKILVKFQPGEGTFPSDIEKDFNALGFYAREE